MGVYHKEVMKQKQKEMKAVTKEIGPKCSKTRYKITRIPWLQICTWSKTSRKIQCLNWGYVWLLFKESLVSRSFLYSKRNNYT